MSIHARRVLATSRDPLRARDVVDLPSYRRNTTPHAPVTSVTELLAKASAGDAAALDGVFPLVYTELRRLARRQLEREAVGHTLSPTALVHEAYLRLIGQTRAQWKGRAHFLAIAATAMRRILVDRLRSHRTLKRGGLDVRLSIESVDLASEDRDELLLTLDDALARLEQLDPRQARVVECRFFGGMTEEETAEALGIGLRTAKRDWAKARSWLYREIQPEAGAPPFVPRQGAVGA